MAPRARSDSGNCPPLDERQEVLRRTLKGLPDEMLVALDLGLFRHEDYLVSGRLYRSRRRGGCAVGVMLRELDPQYDSRGRVRFWLRDRWRRGIRSYRGELGDNPRLRHLEWVFDNTVRDLRALGLKRGRAIRTAGRWVRRETERELHWRATEASLEHGADHVAGEPVGEAA